MKRFYGSTTSMSQLCDWFGRTRQAIYAVRHRTIQRALEASIVLELIDRERESAPRIGGRALYRILKDEIRAHGIKMGRDALFDLMREHNLLIRPKKRYTTTTFSRHDLRKYKNIAQYCEVTQAEQLWVSDITYIRLVDGFAYLTLITDAYSRRIMGYHLSEDMYAESCKQALIMALNNREFLDRELIHHSDRGLQYCSQTYTELLDANNIEISMTENGDPYENALAERMNRTCKDTFDLGRTFTTFSEAQTATEIAMAYYNERRPHSSIDQLTPMQAHQKQGVLKKHWKKRPQKTSAIQTDRE